ncbi:cupin domain-containing protein [Roseitranquillus sediminis]|uniref:cupin domain-containing protein n=1 Tax=Roseitranquillus sediminis TaxID=2809051 RepID=UPI001D0CAB2E|nr:cupin domain-containing protein [Roseitranquillus sediminis]MBM9594419.1 cupin domain-containing protein [Roseitranquillus sediminis]
MERQRDSECLVVRWGEPYHGKQGLSYFAGISAETTGASGICMHLLTILPGQRARAHLHQDHETAIYMIAGEVEMWYGPRLEHHLIVRAGDMLYIPAGVPHLPANTTTEPAFAVAARTDPNEQESVVLRPDLDPLAP